MIGHKYGQWKKQLCKMKWSMKYGAYLAKASSHEKEKSNKSEGRCGLKKNKTKYGHFFYIHFYQKNKIWSHF